jgi:hypothetical protein
MSAGPQMIRFEASSGGTIELKLPESIGRLEPRKERLDRICAAICSEWLAREPRDKSVRRKVRRSDLERACYQLIIWCLEGDGLPYLLRQRAKINGYGSRKLRPRKNVFQVGLDAIFPKRSGALTANQRKRLVEEMWFAFRHYIPDFLFVGFIYQTGGSTKIGEIGLDHIMEDLRGWVIEKRTDDGLLQLARGTYPPQIQRAVRERRCELAASDRLEDVMRVLNVYAKVTDGRRRRFDPKGDFDPAQVIFGRS